MGIGSKCYFDFVAKVSSPTDLPNEILNTGWGPRGVHTLISLSSFHKDSGNNRVDPQLIDDLGLPNSFKHGAVYKPSSNDSSGT